MRFGALVCIRCSQSGHLSYQCKKPNLELQPTPKKEEDPQPSRELEPLDDVYDQQVWY
jgi:hypothetical protein